MFKIPLRNIKKDIVAYSLVDEEDYENAMKYKWNSFGDGYARGTFKGTSIFLHQFVLGKAPDNMVIDHINGDKLDNRKENLKFATKNQNGQNRPKAKNASSQYIGVSHDTRSCKWKAQSHFEGRNMSLGSFDDELEAAKKYDTFVLVHFGKDARTNGLVEYDDVKDIKVEILIITKKTREYPKFIRKQKNSFEVTIAYKGVVYNKTVPTLEKALTKLQEFQDTISNIKQKELDEHLKREIVRNEEGIATITIKDKNGDIVDNVLVSDEDWHDVMMFPWCKSRKYYQTRVENRVTLLHQFIMKTRTTIIDHIDKDPKNNRRENLRLSNSSANCHNKTKNSKATSQYYGVSFLDNAWSASLKKNGIKYYLGRFKDEISAALAYNEKAKELYGEFANLNEIKI